MQQLVFVTGSDTGVGKTVLTGLLLSHLRQSGCHALGIKPFCSGGRADAELLHSLQDDELSLDEINPFHFKSPVTPLVAARLQHRKVPLRSVVTHLRGISRNLHPSTLLIEFAGGLLSPLGEPSFKVQGSKFKVQSSSYSAVDVITRFSPPRSERRAMRNTKYAILPHVVLVAANRLGTINHTLLTVSKLQQAGIRESTVVLMDHVPSAERTPDMRSNPAVLSELLGRIPLIHLPYLGPRLENPIRIRALAKRLAPELGRLCECMKHPIPIA